LFALVVTKEFKGFEWTACDLTKPIFCVVFSLDNVLHFLQLGNALNMLGRPSVSLL